MNRQEMYKALMFYLYIIINVIGIASVIFSARLAFNLITN